MWKYCEDDKHRFTKVVTQTQTMYVCKTCTYTMGYVKPGKANA